MYSSVKEIMIPISQYATVTDKMSIKEALAVLKSYQQKAKPGDVYPRAVLVQDKDGKIIGKLGYQGFMKALDLKYHYLDDVSSYTRSQVNKKTIENTMNDLGFWEYNCPAIREMASKTIIGDVIKDFNEDHVTEDCSASEAMHRMIQKKVLSFLVSNGKEITGIVRLIDLFGNIAEYILADQES